MSIANVNVVYPLTRPQRFRVRPAPHTGGAEQLEENEKAHAERDEREFFKQPVRGVAARATEQAQGVARMASRSYREAFGTTPILPNDDLGTFDPADSDIIEHESNLSVGLTPLASIAILAGLVIFFGRRLPPVASQGVGLQ